MRIAALGLCLVACHSPDAVPSAKLETPPSLPATPSASPEDAAVPSADPVLDGGARSDGGDEALESGEATRAAKAAGMKASIFVPYPVHCPVAPPPHGDPARLEAKAGLTMLMVDPEGFLRPDVGVGDLVSMLGPAVLCNHEAKSAYMTMHLAPRHPSIHEVTIETRDGELIGLVVEYAPPVKVDMSLLDKRYGGPRSVSGPLDSHEAGGVDYSVKNGSFEAQLMFSHKDRSDPRAAWQVHQVIFRRTPTIEILPDAFRTTADVARLVALALRPRAPEPVRFYGTLGVYDKTVGDHITFRGGVQERNVARASIDRRTRDGRDAVSVIDVMFTTPIPTSKAALATAFKATEAKESPGAVTLALPGGRALVQLAGGKMVSITVRRSDP